MHLFPPFPFPPDDQRVPALRLALTIVFLIITLLWCSPPSTRAEQQPVIVTGNLHSPPIMWKKSGTITGIGPQLIGLILPEMGVRYEIVDKGNWQEVQKAAQTGEVDMLVGAYQNDERKKYLLFSEPYFTEPVSVVVKENAPFSLVSWRDLENKKGVTPVGESYGQQFDTFMIEHLDVQRASMKKCFDLLLSEEVDYLIIDFFKGVNYTRMLRKEQQVHFIRRPLLIEQLCLAVAKSSPLADRLPAINKRLQQLSQDGTVARLVREATEEFDRSMRERERMFRRARQDVDAAEGIDPDDRPDFHQRYKEAIGGAIFLVP